MRDEEFVAYIDGRRYEFLGFWEEYDFPIELGTWHYDSETDTALLVTSCLLSQDYKYEFKEIFIFAYDETTGFEYTKNLERLHNLSLGQIQELAELIISSQPELFSVEHVQATRLRNLFSAS